MSYKVLARKYRPASFQDLEGQQHVSQALINALDSERLHHAWLFTGTRGVGKTTIARILARCLNCETGITSTPCGECNSCLEIAEGRSVDLIEVDAASRTGVEDMRELLENVQYMPTASRFKIYLIDEVHMLSRSSFNAMLKTLEEPPEHVKFLFATTDPKKLPITVLSRCLQFNLKNLTPEQVVHYLGLVLEQESIKHDENALWQLGHAADGSMRDALSLTDQAISFGKGEVRDELVRNMLGTLDRQEVHALLDAIVAKEGTALLDKIASLSEYAPDYAGLLDDLLAILHRLAIAQVAPKAVDNAQGDRELILDRAKQVPAEDVQLFYQIGLIGQRDLPLAPTPRTGFEMVLLRMMSFTPKAVPRAEPQQTDAPAAPVESSAEPSDAPAAPAGKKPAEDKPAAEKPAEMEKKAKKAKEKEVEENKENAEKASAEEPAEEPVEEPVEEKVPVEKTPAEKAPAPKLESANWSEILSALALTGMTENLAAHCQLEEAGEDYLQLRLAEEHASLWDEKHEARITEELHRLYGSPLRLVVEIGATTAETPAQQREREQKDRQARAVADFESDSRVRQLVENFNGKLDPASITPLGN